MEAPRITLPASAWRTDAAEPRSIAALHTTLEINGCSMHVMAISVDMRDGVQRGVNDDLDATLDLMSNATGAGDPWETVDIDGRDYVLLVTPFGQ